MGIVAQLDQPDTLNSPLAPALATPFSIDAGSEVPVSLQLAWRLRTLIASRRLSPGDALPSVRSLAEWAGVNVNTVRAVYSGLEDQGLVSTRHGAGTFVADGVAASPEVERIAAEAVAAATDAGIDPSDVAIAAMTVIALREQLPDPALESNQLSARRTLREQIARLETQLAGVWHELDPEQRPALRRGEAHVASVAELEATRDRLLSQLEGSRTAAMDREDGRRAARERRDAMLADPASYSWERITAEEVGEPGCREWSVEPRFGPLGGMMRWWQVKVSGGCPLPAPLAAVADRHC